MTTYEHCPPDTELLPVMTLDSIFEMEQVVEILEIEGIPWKVVQADDILLKSFSANLGLGVLWVPKGLEEKALGLLEEFRANQAKGRECESCGLWLGSGVERCPACFPSGQ